jgi:hypothetical protein
LKEALSRFERHSPTSEKAQCIFSGMTFGGYEAHTILRNHFLLRAGRVANLKTMLVPLQEHCESLKILAEPNALSRSVWGNTSEPSIYAHERYVGDSQSWIVPLDTSGIIPATRPSYLTNYAGFRVCPQFTTLPHYAICTHLVRSVALEHQYIVLVDYADPSGPSADKPFETQRFEPYRILGITLQLIP